MPSENRIKVLNVISNSREGVTTGEIKAATGLSYPTVLKWLEVLSVEGLVGCHRVGKARLWLPGEVAEELVEEIPTKRAGERRGPKADNRMPVYDAVKSSRTGLTTAEVQAATAISYPNVLKWLRELRDEGLIEFRRAGDGRTKLWFVPWELEGMGEEDLKRILKLKRFARVLSRAGVGLPSKSEAEEGLERAAAEQEGLEQ